MRRKMKLWRGLTAVTGILLCLSILMTDLLVEWSGQVNVVLGVTIPTTVVDGDKWVYPSEYGMNEEGLAAMLAASDAHDIQTMIEGAVLLKNNGSQAARLALACSAEPALIPFTAEIQVVLLSISAAS